MTARVGNTASKSMTARVSNTASELIDARLVKVYESKHSEPLARLVIWS